MKKGFTLIELLVVVLIIGILAAISLPQYRMAVTKSRVASILPLMRRWKDALMEYKLQHGDYCLNGNCPDGSDLGVNWPTDWSDGECGDSTDCANDYWDCAANDGGEGGIVYCSHVIGVNDYFYLNMYQPDDLDNEDFRDRIICFAGGTEAHKVCKALGGTLVDGYDDAYQL